MNLFDRPAAMTSAPAAPVPETHFREALTVEFVMPAVRPDRHHPDEHPPRHQLPRRLHHVFERGCDRHPDRIALECGDQRLTYRELDERANRLAHHLRGLGIGSGRRVAILLQRSVETYVALLAVGKAGAAFVPIDPESPPDRIAYIAQDSAVDLLLTSPELIDRTAGLDRLALLVGECLDGAGPSTAARPRSRSERLRHLHLRLQRPTQGRRGGPVEHLQLPRRGPDRLRRPTR